MLQCDTENDAGQWAHHLRAAIPLEIQRPVQAAAEEKLRAEMQAARLAQLQVL